ncbi:hypothetical protein AA101099_0775 [Neoasaia chiangmaiensis NBRC 101099]|uniref:Uncharacterized protein n=1 Tax=Neoasaia chiangmaiensis TaxID=320497 RepID=A0A1U9KME9_9PROT|nr:hypothetical protein [Neoasaia chiangmaiensis]AQS86910.1 hypothetical protein A0U93_01945 [Neoasaia chiangmaiensis]GBR37562.1 hypothetical protein AA101099_0775 [Neoasaia chiangmaiensis NBRC 101099]GEN15010.1 hypothetical protein NCH01_14410 [Neoasaia chiangmaiensis]
MLRRSLSRRLLTVSTVSLATFLASPPVLAAETTPADNQGAAVSNASPVTTHHNAFGKLTSFSLSAVSKEPAPIIQPAVGHGHAEVLEVRAQSRFSDAPVPNDMDAPVDTSGETDPSLEPDFFRRNTHQAGDALSNGASVNQQRRGHGNMAAGIALAVPMTQ